MESESVNRPRHNLALLSVLATLGLVCLGGLVTSHGAGMAVPDWPNTYGYNMFFFPVSQWVGGIFYEHTHRLLGSLVGLLTLLLTLWLHGAGAKKWLRWGGGLLVGGSLVWLLVVEGRRDWALITGATGLAAWGLSWFWPRCQPASARLRALGLVALFGVIFQGVLGGLRVVLLQDAIGIVHATLAQLFLLLMCLIALLTSPWWQSTTRTWNLGLERSASFRALVLWTTLAILGQLVLGASMRHRHAGLAIPDFPLAYGRVWPKTDSESLARYNRERTEENAVNFIQGADVNLHMAHRVMALGVLALLTLTAVRARRALGARHDLARLMALWAAMGYVQLLLGAITVWSNKSADLATAHVAVGSALLAGGGLLVLLAWRPSGQSLGSESAVASELSANLPAIEEGAA